MSHSYRFLLCLCAYLIGSSCLSAQFKPGGGISLDRDAIPGGSSAIIPKPAPKTTRTTTYVTLTPDRKWTSSEGKTLQGKLIAFEDMIIEVPVGQTPEPSKPPAHPTVIKEGKVRFFINKKPYVLALDKLSAADQEEIRKIESAHAPKAEPNP